MLSQVAKKHDALPEDTCPRDESVPSLTLNPEYIAISYFPTDPPHDVGTGVVGDRPRLVTPEKRSRGREPEKALTTESFARGHRAAFREWSQSLPDWSDDGRVSKSPISIEEVEAPSPRSKIRSALPDEDPLLFEVVLHADGLEGEINTLGKTFVSH